ncbi:OmpA family protein [Catellatospora sp. NPDC049609]|uniref:OmpA family protein n=1 Tax=Catellatospora sp. NPDC049609 TaxID=3155505 RepID=UPI00343279D1
MANNDRRFSPLVGLAVAALGLAGIITAQHLPVRERVQDDLTRRSEQALQAAGLSSVRVSFVGRDGTLRVTSAADADKALAIVRALEGVRVAEAEVPTVAEPAPTAAASPSATAPTSPPEVTATLAGGGRITLSGRVPDETAKARLVKAATDAAGAGMVDDRLTVDPAVTDKGLDGLGLLLTAVAKHSTDLTVQLRGDKVEVTGTVDTAATAQEADAAAKAMGVTDVAISVKVTEVEQALGDLKAVTFVNDKTSLTPAGRAALTRAAQVLAAAPAVKVRVEGHTDDKGTAASNLALSRARAKAVVDFLVSQGIAADRLTAAGFGETRPAVPNTSEANRAVNRRVEFIVAQ